MARCGAMGAEMRLLMIIGAIVFAMAGGAMWYKSNLADMKKFADQKAEREAVAAAKAAEAEKIEQQKAAEAAAAAEKAKLPLVGALLDGTAFGDDAYEDVRPRPANAEACAAACVADAKCVAFTYAPERPSCKLIDKAPDVALTGKGAPAGSVFSGYGPAAVALGLARAN